LARFSLSIAHKSIWKKKKIESIFGRIRRLPQVRSPYPEKVAEAYREGLNALVQGTASDLTQQAVIRICAMLKEKRAKTRFLFSVHDAIITEVYKTEHHLIPIMRDLMENVPSELNFPIKASADRFTKRWGSDAIEV